MTTIRPFTTDDYAAIVEINNLIWEDEPTTVERLSKSDEHRAPYITFQRWVAEKDDQVIGMAEYHQLEGRYHPDKYWLEIDVHPAHQRQGVGSALYDQVIEGVKTHNPLLARVAFQETMPAAKQFLTKRGFTEEWRSWDWKLDVVKFEQPDTSELDARLTADGIEIKTFNELADDPNRSRKLFDLHEETRQDAPMPDPATPMNFETYIETFERHFNKDSYFVAVKGPEYIGLSMLEDEDPGEEIETGWTGIRQDYRGQGLSMALKLRVIEYANANNHPIIWTTTNSLNYPMMIINERLGFERDVAWVYYTKIFRRDT